MRTLTAMFDSRAEAENARDRLAVAGVSADGVTILDQSHLGAGTSDSSGSLWESFKSLFQDDEASYAEGLRRGSFLLSAQVEDSQTDRVIDILDDEGTVDLDQRTSDWRNEGWTGGHSDAPGLIGGHDVGDRRQAAAGSDETHIPIVEEEVRVGKREVARGGVRVRSYVVEQPVNESVRLREEHVSVDRRPVTGAAPENTADLLRERTIEVTETSEEAVIDKQAHVREEVVIGKTVEDRVEQISDTVRHTEVEVEQLHGDSRDRDEMAGSHRTNDPMRR